MANTGQIAALKAKCYCGQAIFLSLWLAIGYLWMALFFPLMCAPYRVDAPVALDQTTAFEHTITPFSVMTTASMGWSHTIRAADSSNAAWLLDTHTDVVGVALTFISVISLPLLAWLLWSQPRHIASRLHTLFYAQLHLAPPKRPPRFSFI